MYVCIMLLCLELELLSDRIRICFVGSIYYMIQIKYHIYVLYIPHACCVHIHTTYYKTAAAVTGMIYYVCKLVFTNLYV